MNFIIQINCILKDEFSYDIQLKNELQPSGVSFEFIDLDNFSETFLINQTKLIIEKSTKGCIYLKLIEQVNLNRFIPLLTYCLDHPEKTKIFIQGNHPLINKMIPDSQRILINDQNLNSLKENILTFFNY